jgi:hypothetical protein
MMKGHGERVVYRQFSVDGEREQVRRVFGGRCARFGA